MFVYREVVSLLRLRPTLRTQLTLLYGGLLAVLGGGLLFLLVPLQGSASVAGRAARGGDRRRAEQRRTATRRSSAPSPLPVVVLLAVAGGWLIAGRLLRPLRTITATARDISASNLSRRLALGGRDDEFAELGETLDDLFGRLEAAFESQRHFVANASHELRTPLTAERTLLQVALADPDASAATLRSACEQTLALGESAGTPHRGAAHPGQRGERHRGVGALRPGRDRRQRRAARREDAERRGIEVSAALSAAPAKGDPRLAESLVVNLVDNAIRYNVAGGRVAVSTIRVAGQATLRISNTGAVIPPGEVERLFEPFQRLGGVRTRNGDGYGLGLAIVRAIAGAHGATLTSRAQPEGGLDIEVSFPGQPPD